MTFTIRLSKPTAVLLLLAVVGSVSLLLKNFGPVQVILTTAPQEKLPDTKSVEKQASQMMERPANYPFMCGVDQSSEPELVKYVRDHVLIPPSTEEYKLTHPEMKDASEFESMSKVVIPKYFANMTTKGIFVEGGVVDGEHHSQSLILEKEMGWKGLIYDMNPLNKDLVLSKHRKAYFAPVCLSQQPWPVKKGMSVSYNPTDINSRVGATVFDDVNAIAGKVNSSSATRNEFYGVVDCYPFLTLLLASNMTKIDFMRLDVEGFELKILQTIPWDKIKIRVISLDLIITHEGKEAAKQFLTTKGYQHVYGDTEPAVFVNEKF